MTIRVVLCCEGTPADRPGIALERCREFVAFDSGQAAVVRRAAARAGWSSPAGRDLCPACTRARQGQTA